MIEFTKAFKTSTGQTVGTLREAKSIELSELLRVTNGDTAQLDIIESILNAAEGVVDILTTTESCRPKARKINGGKKTRKPKPETVPLPVLV